MEQKKVYSEVYAVLSALNNDYLKKTPQKILDKINAERDRNYRFRIDENIPLTEQNLSSEAIAMLAALKLDYWCKSKAEKEELELLLKANDKSVKLSSNLKKILFKNSQQFSGIDFFASQTAYIDFKGKFSLKVRKFAKMAVFYSWTFELL